MFPLFPLFTSISMGILFSIYAILCLHSAFRNVTPRINENALYILEYICSDRILTFGIRSIYSPAKVGIGCYKVVNYQPGN